MKAKIDCIIDTNPLSGCKDILDFRCLCQTYVVISYAQTQSIR